MDDQWSHDDQLERDAQHDDTAHHHKQGDALARLWHAPLLRWTLALAVLGMTISTSWALTIKLPLGPRIAFAALMGCAFIYLTTEFFVTTLVTFSFAAVFTLAAKGFLLAIDHYSAAPVATMVGIVGAGMAFLVHVFDKHRFKCEKCGHTLDDRHLMDDETVSIYRCPRCKQINHHRWPDRAPAE
jgi:phage FluMu protein Com